MRFGKTLRESIYPPWKDKYVDYGKLKSLLREDKRDDETVWTEEDESRFCDEIFNVQLEKVAQFQQERFDDLKQRVETAFEKLKEFAPPAESNAEAEGSGSKPDTDREATASKLREIEAELDEITNEVKALKKYSNINYTSFLKIVKKHDRKRGDRYKVRPMMQLSLAQRPFNSEQGYSPLLNKLSVMYFAIRQQLEEGDQVPLDLDALAETHNGERYTAHKFWVHPDNLLEVKTLILRRLPALVYSEQSAKELDASDSPSITSLYFDNPKFEVYSEKIEQQSEVASLRLRWYGQLSSKPEIFVEQKSADATGKSEEHKFTIKPKYIKQFLDGEYTADKTVQKMERQGESQEQIEAFRSTVARVQEFQQKRKLAPVLRANYVRTAFQKPADDRVRISIDTDLAFIREDTLDKSRPCRDPNEWHRTDIDNSNMKYPFPNINQSEVSKFPYAVLEIKLKEDGSRKRPTWIEDLMGSHLVHPSPRFSKFVHGVASLFDDYVNNLPFWLGDLEIDIRKDPQKAFEEEEQRRAQRADDVMAVGSLIGTVPSSYKAAQSSPVGKSYLAERMAADATAYLSRSLRQRPQGRDGAQDEEGEGSSSQAQQRGYGTLSAVLPGLSLSKYARAKRAQKARLPEGVVEPTQWIKNTGELKVEPKVWLANERTFLKWQSIAILQGTLALALYSAAGDNAIAQWIGIAYIGIAAFAGIWGYSIQQVRRSMIVERSGKDFDNMIGPIIISVAMMIALIVNLVLQYQKAFSKMKNVDSDMPMPITDE
ncbi:VTC domain-containing protein [Trichoderma gamsii]|uniref:VTC domain-containing protein n=1 Tax=Trichoderma gamsii TaxID=398673 RepID=A0A2P4ZF00_9HYPO|nr:VTC domain-containing protein [Trichoderma gamsii]PON22861.1 VTC domain-containing protein [Trichoderma gamsii]